MAEFVDVLRQFDRMCGYYQRKRECPMGCPMNGLNLSQCRKVAFKYPNATEKTVMQWAAEHPEHVYPTWSEWLVQMGVFPKMMSTNPIKAIEAISNGVCKPIPDDIAQKLGIEPKNG